MRRQYKVIIVLVVLLVVALVCLLIFLPTRVPRSQRIHVGMTRAEVEQALGPPFMAIPYPGPNPKWPTPNRNAARPAMV
jgi:hypothetical protein